MLHDVNPTKYPYDLKNGTFNVASSTEISLLDIIVPKANAEETVPALNNIVTVKGDKPTSGSVTINVKGKVTESKKESEPETEAEEASESEESEKSDESKESKKADKSVE